MADEYNNAPHLDKVIDPQKVNEDFADVLAVIRPEWKLEYVVFEESPLMISRGMLNKMVTCFQKDASHDSLMVRVSNPLMAEYFDRKHEINLIKYFHTKDCAPNILATFKNGFCYKFIEGEILTRKRLKEEAIWKKVAEEFAKIHAGDYEDETFNRKMVEENKKKFATFWDTYPTEVKDPELNKRFQTELPSKEDLMKEFLQIGEHIDQLGSPIVICHNDPRAENMVWNVETETVNFVDFEAISYGTQALELGKHFSRFAGLSPPDYSLLPDDEFQRKWLRVYLRKYYQLTGRKADDVTDVAVERLHVQVKKYTLMSLLISVITGSIMAITPMEQIGKMDLMGLSVTSYKEYSTTKDAVLALQLPDEES